jgi:peptidyl-prolyl cis-trans isomerase SurA
MKIIIAAVLLMTSAANTMSADTVERIVAKVNGQIITLTELNEEVATALEQLGPTQTEEEQRQRDELLPMTILDAAIDNMLVMQVAAERGLQVPSRFFEEWKQNIMKEMDIEDEEAFERQVALQGGTVEGLQKRFEEGLLLQEVRRMEVDSKVSVSEPEIEERYRLNIEDYTQPPRLRLREIVVRFDDTNEIEQGQKARRLLQDVQQGADFAEVARMHSESGSRDAGGDLGFFNEGELTESLSVAAFALGPGEVSEIIRLDTAFYIIRVEEKEDETTKPLEDVRNEVADAIFQEKMTEQMERFVKQLRERAIIEIKL